MFNTKDYEVPQQIRELVGKAMTSVGVSNWWVAEHQIFENKRPMDVWKTDPQRVIDFINSAKSGDMA